MKFINSLQGSAKVKFKLEGCVPPKLSRRPKESVEDWLDRCYEAGGYLRLDGSKPYSGRMKKGDTRAN